MGGGSQIGRCHVGKDKLITHHSCFKDRTIYGQTGKTVCAHQLFATGSKILMYTQHTHQLMCHNVFSTSCYVHTHSFMLHNYRPV